MKNYALEWYQYGLKNNDDDIVKFMMHWIAFNWLYNEYREGGDEKNAIRTFCRENYNKLSSYNAFRSQAINIFMEQPVRSVVSGMVTSEHNSLYRDVVRGEGLSRLSSLMLTIYHVRCNLFHGSKSLMIKRDLDLVRSSSIILEGYLKAVLSDDIENREIRLRHDLLDWENELKYQEGILKSDNMSDNQKRNAKKRIKEAQDYIDKIKQEQHKNGR